MNETKVHKKLNPVELEIIWNRLITNLEEQANTLIRTSFSNILSDSGDLSAGLFDSKGNMIAQANTGTPGHINSMALGVRHFIDRHPKETLKPGDVLIGNNAYEIAGHLLDVTVVTPIFWDKSLIGYVASTCHVVDIGGRGFNPEADSIYEEGLYLPYLKYYKEGKLDESIQAIIKANVRSSYQVLGDLRAQVVSQEVSIKRLIEMLKEFELDELDVLGEEIIKRSEAAIRKAIIELPDGTYKNEIYTDGVSESIKLQCKIIIKNDEIKVDFSGTSKASQKGVNVALYYTLAYVTYALKSVIAPEVPNNEGSFRPLSITAPEGCVLNAKHPMPTAARHIIGHFVPACVLGALYYAKKDYTVADGANSIWAVQVSGKDKEENPFSYVTFNNGGMGARPNKDGLSATGFPSGVRGTPVEITESTSPIIIYQKEIRNESGGLGKYQGGHGQIIRFGVRSDYDYRMPTMFDRVNYEAKGLDGGGPGAKGEVLLNGKEAMEMKRLHTLRSQDVVTLKLPGGGGYGKPEDRDPVLVLNDVMNEYISKKTAEQAYGVALIQTRSGWEIDWAETKKLRE